MPPKSRHRPPIAPKSTKEVRQLKRKNDQLSVWSAVESFLRSQADQRRFSCSAASHLSGPLESVCPDNYLCCVCMDR
eukprot:gene12670-10863_t